MHLASGPAEVARCQAILDAKSLHVNPEPSHWD